MVVILPDWAGRHPERFDWILGVMRRDWYVELRNGKIRPSLPKKQTLHKPDKQETELSSMSQSSYAQMQTALEKWGPVPSALREELQKLFQSCEYHKGSHLALPGATLRNVFFVSRRLLRFYTVGDNGKDWNKGFAVENDLIGSFTSQSPNWPSSYGLQALEKTTLLRVPEPDFQALLARCSEFEHIIRCYVEALLRQKGRRIQKW